LQVLDDGRITDSQGKMVDFKNTVIIMTSNIGSHLLLENKDLEDIPEETRQEVMGQLKMHFRPELLNRIDEIILFKPLALAEIKEIVTKLVAQLQSRLLEQQISVSITDKAKEYIACNGFDPVYGARPLKRFLQRTVETYLAKDIIAEKIKENDHVIIDVEKDKIVLLNEQ